MQIWDVLALTLTSTWYKGNMYKEFFRDRLRPLIKWSGGKYKEIRYFEPYYPYSFDMYLEPFAGAGAVYFDLFFDNNLISDVHEELINFYQQIKAGRAKDMYRWLSGFCEGKAREDQYYYIRDGFEPKDEFGRAIQFYYLRKTCFRGMLRYNNSGKFNVPFGFYDQISMDKLIDDRYELILKNTDVRCVSYEEVFEEFNDPKYFMFLDPPYDSTFSNYGYCEFGREHHRTLANYFRNTKCMCLMVVGKSDLMLEEYGDYVVDKYDKNYMFKIHSGRIGNEINNEHLVIKNY